MAATKASTYRLSPAAKRVLKKLANRHGGLSQRAMLEYLIFEKADQLKLGHQRPR